MKCLNNEKIEAWSVYVLLFALSLIVGLSRGWEGVPDGDSLWYAGMAKEIVNSGDWLILRYKGLPYFDHPPLCIWMIAILYKIFGVSLYVAKIMNTLTLFGVLLFTYWIGSLLRCRTTGLIASLIFVLTPQVLQFSGRIRMDIPLTFFVALAVLGIVLAFKKSKHGFWLYGLGTAGAILTKGVPGIAPLAIAFGSIILLRRWRLLVSWQFILSTLLALLIPAIWVEEVFRAGFGHLFYSHYIENQLLVSFRGERWDKAGIHGFWYFIWVLLRKGIPWTWLFPVGLWCVARDWWRNRSFDLWIVILLWMVVIYCGFSIPKHKYVYYILPIYPALSLFVATLFIKYLSIEKLLKGGLAGLVLVALILATIPVKIRHERSQGFMPLLPVIQEEVKKHDIKEIGAVDLPPYDEENVYQLLAFYINTRFVVKKTSIDDLNKQKAVNTLFLLPSGLWKEGEAYAKRFSIMAETSQMKLIKRHP